MIRNSLTLLCLLLIFSCSRDKLDFDMMDDLRFNPDMELPLIKATLDLSDLAELDSSLIVDPDNAVRIKYTDDSIFSFNTLDFVKIPAQDELKIPLSPSFPVLDPELSLGTLGGVQLHQTTFEKGFFKIALQAQSPYSTDVDVEITINNASSGGVMVSRILSLTAGNLYASDSVDMNGVTFDFTNNNQDVNYIGMKVEILNAASVSPNQPLELVTQFKDLKVEYTNGLFGEREINIPSGNFDFDISGLKKFAQGFYLTNPSIKLNVLSTVGVSLGLQTDFDGVNGTGEITPLSASQQTVSAATDVNTPQFSQIEFNKNNSNIVDFLAALPSEIMYSGKAVLNSGGTTNTNFIGKDSRVNVGIEIDIPLELRADNMILDEVLNDIDFFKDDPEEVESLTLIFYTNNGFPFDFHLGVDILHAETGDSINGFELPLLNAAPVDGNGRVTAHSAPAKIEVTFERSMLESLKLSDKLRLTAKLNTSNSGQQVVKMYTDYDLEVKIAARAKLNIKVKD